MERTGLSCAAKQWLGCQPPAASILLGPPTVEVRNAGYDRGLGLFAAAPLAPFSRIVTDEAMILMKPTDDFPELYSQVLQLPKDQRDTYLALSYPRDASRDANFRAKLLERGLATGASTEDTLKMIKVANIMQTNAFNVNLRNGQAANYRALFPRIARINHSCAPNAHVCFYPSDNLSSGGRMILHALRPIRQGEEVLISYFNILLPRTERQTKSQKWGFQCHCPICQGTTGTAPSPETQRNNVNKFMLDGARLMQSPLTTVKDVNAVLETGKILLSEASNDSSLFPALPDLCDALAMLQAKWLVAQSSETNRDVVNLSLEQAALWEAKITGCDSPAVHERLSKLARFSNRKGRFRNASIEDKMGVYTVVWSKAT